MNRGFYLVVVMVTLLAFGCSDGTDSGEVFTPGSGHPDTWVNPAFLGTEGFHGSVVTGETRQQGTSRQIEPDGADLFASNCAACHGSDASGGIGPNIQGKTAADIQSAIDTVSAMAFLKGTLTPDQIQAIADFLATLVGGAPPPAAHIDASLCMQCHGTDLDGGIAHISCFACHNGPTGTVGHPPTWLSEADPVHFHGRYARDFGIACTACHGTDLTGGIGPSCFLCHAAEELEDVLAQISEAEN